MADQLNLPSVVSSTDPLKQIRSPNIIVTDGYLNDPIKFDVDPRFQDQTSISRASETGSIPRDFAEFLQIDRNSEKLQTLSVNMISPHWDRVSYEKVIGTRARFTQFGVTP